jgi:hypothetical protein
MNDSTQNWERILALAQRTQSIDLLYLALEAAEVAFGEDSPQVGQCLIELSTLLEQSGKVEEANRATDRYREILRKYAQELKEKGQI